MSPTHSYQVLAFYHLIPIENPHEEVRLHKAFFEGKDIASRIYISEEGINGQMSASPEAAALYMEWMHSRPAFQNIPFKIHLWNAHAFPRQTVKYRPKLVGHDEAIDLAQRGTHVSPQEWRSMLESDQRYLMLDVRNDYEWQLGHFEGAELPACETFRDFERYAEDLKKEKDPAATPVMMYCTGGIRCELYSSILKQKGFKDVYQLQGGIIQYGLEEGSKHWLGKLFVFDDRLSVPISDEPAPVIAKCHQCGCAAETYYNCANMDCNNLFISCQECFQTLDGCCCSECSKAPRVRPYNPNAPHIPFRRKSQIC